MLRDGLIWPVGSWPEIPFEMGVIVFNTDVAETGLINMHAGDGYVAQEVGMVVCQFDSRLLLDPRLLLGAMIKLAARERLSRCP